MKLIFERSVAGRSCALLPACDVPAAALPESLARKQDLHLPALSVQPASTPVLVVTETILPSRITT